MKICLPKIFLCQAVSIVGGGESLIDFDFSRLRRPVFAVNSSIYFVDEPDLFISLDERFYEKHQDKICELNCPLISNKIFHPDKDLPFTIPAHYEKEDPVDRDLRQANLSGLTAIQVALTLGAEVIYLFGFDGGYSNQSNYYPNDIEHVTSWRYEMQNDRFDHFKDKPIINVGLGSRIASFHKVDLNSDFYETGFRILGKSQIFQEVVE